MPLCADKMQNLRLEIWSVVAVFITNDVYDMAYSNYSRHELKFLHWESPSLPTKAKTSCGFS